MLVVGEWNGMQLRKTSKLTNQQLRLDRTSWQLRQNFLLNLFQFNWAHWMLCVCVAAKVKYISIRHFIITIIIMIIIFTE